MGFVYLVAAVLMYPLGRRIARSMLGVGPREEPPTRGKRAALALAGPLWCWLVGVTPMLFVASREIGTPTLTIEKLEPDLPAAAAGVLPGDTIETIDGAKISAFDEVRTALARADGGTLEYGLRRGEERVAIKLASQPGSQGEPRIGIWPHQQMRRPSFIEVFVDAHVAPMRVFGQLAFGEVNFQPVSGPVSTQVREYGLRAVLASIAMVLAMYCFLVAGIMLLPIPGLDGATLAVIAIGRKPHVEWHARARRRAVRVLWVLLGLLALLVLKNDVVRLLR